ncbi:MAG: MaoC family dehydratase [Flammeovirgaceae bacterium]
MQTINSLDALKVLKGKEIGKSDWLEITQERINDFAQATGDYQWIHVDAERCKSESPFGKPIAHGYLTLSLIPVLFEQILEVKNIRMAVNYGLNKTRFLAPVKVNSRIRLKLEMAQCEEVKRGLRVVNTCTVEIEGQEKPACIAESIVLYYA